MADEIPAEYVGSGKWVTLKTENGYYFYAIEEDGKIKLGQTMSAPTEQNYAAYCWQIEGDVTEGYTFRCLKYENDADGKKYITNPETLGTCYQEVILSTTASKYYYTSNHQFQLKNNTSLYLAFYSQSFHTIRLHNSVDYIGSKMVIGGIYDWSVAAVVYGTETIGQDGLPQGTYLPDGGVVYNGMNYTHGSSLYLTGEPTLATISLTGFTKSTIKIDKENRYIVAYYVGNESGINYKNAETTKDSETAVTGEDNTIWTLDARNYITNTSGNYTNVPAEKAWQMEMVVQNTNTSGDDPSFNKWGSCILSSCSDPLNTYYWGDFQVYQHAPTHSSPNTLNFKSSKGDGYDHIIAQGVSVKNRNYKVIVRYNAKNVYVIRTIMLDANLTETADVYDNVWVSARQQNAVSQMSSALPTGINLKSLKISIAEESNLLEGTDYAIQNIDNTYYLTGTALANSAFAGDAAKYQIEWTKSQDLTYDEGGDGGLHNSFYIKIGNQYLDASNGLTSVKAQAQAFIYTTQKVIAPISAKNTLKTPWEISGNNKWEFDFFANFYVEVAGNNNGGLKYIKGGEPKTATNGQYLELPSGVKVEQLANSSQPGYSASISKSDIRIKVQYTPLEDTFYNFTDKTTNTTTLYYWYKPENTLVSYSTTNSQSGQRVEWGERGDCSKFTIVKVTTIPVKMNLNNTGSNADNKYYGTIYCPNALTLPNGVTAYRLNNISGDNYLLKPIEGNILAAATPAVLISANNDDPSGNWTIDVNNTTTMSETNLFLGVFEDTTNPGAEQQTRSPIYVLGNQPVNGDTNLGFYPYSDAMIPAFKAYHKTQGSQAPVRFLFTFDEGDESNAIRNHKQTSAPGNGIYYDLAGRAVGTPLRGHIYIYVTARRSSINPSIEKKQ